LALKLHPWPLRLSGFPQSAPNSQLSPAVRGVRWRENHSACANPTWRCCRTCIPATHHPDTMSPHGDQCRQQRLMHWGRRQGTDTMANVFSKAFYGVGKHGLAVCPCVRQRMSLLWGDARSDSTRRRSVQAVEYLGGREEGRRKSHSGLQRS